MVKRYPLAAKMGKNIFDCKPNFAGTKNSRTCEKAYKLAANLQSAHDLCEEYIVARVWPLRKRWSFVHFHKKVMRGKDYLYPDKEAFCLKMYSRDEDFVSAVELKAVEILGKFLKKEKDLLDKILGKDYKHLNRVFEIAQIKYGERSPPAYARAAKPSIENVMKKRAGGQLTKKASKKKKVSALFDSERIGEDEVDLGLDVDRQEVLSQQAHDDENLGATLHSSENVGEASLVSPRRNIGEDTLPSPLVIPASSLALDAGAAADVTASVDVQMEEARARKGKGTTTLTLDFNESDDDVFDEEARDDRASCLTESTINVNIGEKVSCQLEKVVSTDAEAKLAGKSSLELADASVTMIYKQLEKEIVADEKLQREQDKRDAENARDDDVGDHLV
ncbi:unnamed protein product [Miscanthus lutarioriparius]|uniref:Uncharacterized protein n=1 Tax=Miscanthus lutarioriparius TaxID=422564 RepID=A0A811MG50_9POAL|nr:unnamed protein product [Miscanthus lutarioriparius]